MDELWMKAVRESAVRRTSDGGFGQCCMEACVVSQKVGRGREGSIWAPRNLPIFCTMGLRIGSRPIESKQLLRVRTDPTTWKALHTWFQCGCVSTIIL